MRKAIKDHNDILHPKMQLLVKLGSIAVHADEMLGPKGHEVDKAALCSLLNDEEVQAWLKIMAKLSLLPVKR